MLLWDGLQVGIPAGMEPITLDRGFIRLAGRDGGGVELRFAAEKSLFSPDRDGRRILRAAGLGQERLNPCEEEWAGSLPGTLYRASRLWVLRFGDPPGLAAMLFPAPPASDLLQPLCRSLSWTPATAWRQWSCYDIAFETPPGYLLGRAIFRQGHFRLSFMKGGAGLTYERMAPADVLLDGRSLREWSDRAIPGWAEGGEVVVADGGREIAVFRRPSLFGRVLAAAGIRSGAGCTQIRHLAGANRILIIREEGPPLSGADRKRCQQSYVVAETHQT
jgi:hypothetical protein